MAKITKSRLAAELGITKARVSQLCRRGLPVLTDGTLDRTEALNWLNRNQSHFGTQGETAAARAAELLKTAGRRKANGVALASPPEPKPAEVQPDAPFGYGVIDKVENDFDRGALTMALYLLYRMRWLGGSMAAMAGAPMKVAYAVSTAMPLVVGEEIIKICGALGIEPFASSADPDGVEFITYEAFLGVNWPNLATLAGEEVDLHAWQEYCAELDRGMERDLAEAG